MYILVLPLFQSHNRTINRDFQSHNRTINQETICKRFFEKSVLSSASCLHYVLLPCRDTNIIAKLRSTSVYATPTVQTNRFKKSFIMYALNNY